MKKLLSLLIVITVATQVKGQPSVTFRVNVADLTESGFFSKDLGHKVFVRGSFNNWKGTDFELKESGDPDTYTGIYSIGKTGDTISYKYVIQRGTGNYYWETYPDRTNPDNGNRQVIITRDNIILPAGHFSHDEYIRYPVVFSKEKLREDYLQFRSILESTHPALYDYSPKSVIDSLFDSNFERIGSELAFRTFLILMTEVISRVGCGHSSLWIPGKYWDIAPETLFPLILKGANGKIFASGSYNAPTAIPAGSEIVALNGQPMDQIMKRLMALTSADGFNPAYRYTKAVENFSVKYALAFGFFDAFEVEYRAPGNNKVMQKTVQPVSKKDVDKVKPGSPELSYKLQDESNTGLLTINSFGYYDQVDMFQKFIDSVFTDIKKEKTENLILDLRGNSGGDPFCAACLWAYLEPEPMPYFEDHYGRYDTLANPVPLPQNNFTGRLFTLIDGDGFSTTGHFCGLLKYHKVGKFIGTELGSTYTCTGNATYPPLKNTGIMVGTARVGRYTAAVKDMDRTRGVIPDYIIEPGLEDIINGKDVIKEFALELAKRE